MISLFREDDTHCSCTLQRFVNISPVVKIGTTAGHWDIKRKPIALQSPNIQVIFTHESGSAQEILCGF